MRRRPGTLAAIVSLGSPWRRSPGPLPRPLAPTCSGRPRPCSPRPRPNRSSTRTTPPCRPTGATSPSTATFSGLTGVWRRNVAGGPIEPVAVGPRQPRWAAPSCLRSAPTAATSASRRQHGSIRPTTPTTAPTSTCGTWPIPTPNPAAARAKKETAAGEQPVVRVHPRLGAQQLERGPVYAYGTEPRRRRTRLRRRSRPGARRSAPMVRRSRSSRRPPRTSRAPQPRRFRSPCATSPAAPHSS